MGKFASFSVVSRLGLSWLRMPFQSKIAASTFSSVLFRHCWMISEFSSGTAYFGIMCPNAALPSSAMRVNFWL